MPDITVDVYVYCSCGAHLCSQSTAGSDRRGPYITVGPCGKCTEAADAKGYDAGVAETEARYA